MNHKKLKKNEARTLQPEELGRRTFLTWGLQTLGALAVTGLTGCQSEMRETATGGSPAATPAYPNDINAIAKSHLKPLTLPADLRNAIQASDEIVKHYARELNSPSALIHAVRAFGKEFTLSDGTKAVDHLCSRYFAEKEVNGKKYIYSPREFEVHDNSFLKTLLEAGAPPEQAIVANGNRYTLHDLCVSAKALFRFDPNDTARYDPTLFQQHMPWGLIAFSILTPPAAPTWTNAYGETINLNQVIDAALSNYEHMCEGLQESLAHEEDETLEFRQQITKHSCFGMHSIYGFFSCLKAGYIENRLQERLQKMYDLSIYRLAGDSKAIDREANAARDVGPSLVNRLAVSQDGRVVTKGAPPSTTIEVMRIRSQIRFLGHAFEAINYAELHKLFTLSPEQKKRKVAGEQLFYSNIVQMRAVNLEPYWNWYSKFVANIVIAASHASRAMKLLTPENPDTSSVNVA
jgi:hypothetical protein